MAYIGGPFQGFIHGCELRYDETVPLKEDYDMTLQQLNRYRVVFRWNKFHYQVKQAGKGMGQPGGCAVYRNLEREEEQFLLLQKKWGEKIVQRDTSTVSRSHQTKKRIRVDINPILKFPIKGL